MPVAEIDSAAPSQRSSRRSSLKSGDSATTQGRQANERRQTRQTGQLRFGYNQFAPPGEKPSQTLRKTSSSSQPSTGNTSSEPQPNSSTSSHCTPKFIDDGEEKVIPKKVGPNGWYRIQFKTPLVPGDSNSLDGINTLKNGPNKGTTSFNHYQPPTLPDKQLHELRDQFAVAEPPVPYGQLHPKFLPLSLQQNQLQQNQFQQTPFQQTPFQQTHQEHSSLPQGHLTQLPQGQLHQLPIPHLPLPQMTLPQRLRLQELQDEESHRRTSHSENISDPPTRKLVQQTPQVSLSQSFGAKGQKDPQEKRRAADSQSPHSAKRVLLEIPKDESAQSTSMNLQQDLLQPVNPMNYQPAEKSAEEPSREPEEPSQNSPSSQKSSPSQRSAHGRLPHLRPLAPAPAQPPPGMQVPTPEDPSTPQSAPEQQSSSNNTPGERQIPGIPQHIQTQLSQLPYSMQMQLSQILQRPQISQIVQNHQMQQAQHPVPPAMRPYDHTTAAPTQPQSPPPPQPRDACGKHHSYGYTSETINDPTALGNITLINQLQQWQQQLMQNFMPDMNALLQFQRTLITQQLLSTGLTPEQVQLYLGPGSFLGGYPYGLGAGGMPGMPPMPPMPPMLGLPGMPPIPGMPPNPGMQGMSHFMPPYGQFMYNTPPSVPPAYPPPQQGSQQEYTPKQTPQQTPQQTPAQPVEAPVSQPSEQSVYESSVQSANQGSPSEQGTQGNDQVAKHPSQPSAQEILPLKSDETQHKASESASTTTSPVLPARELLPVIQETSSKAPRRLRTRKSTMAGIREDAGGDNDDDKVDGGKSSALNPVFKVDPKNGRSKASMEPASSENFSTRGMRFSKFRANMTRKADEAGKAPLKRDSSAASKRATDSDDILPSKKLRNQRREKAALKTDNRSPFPPGAPPPVMPLNTDSDSEVNNDSKGSASDDSDSSGSSSSASSDYVVQPKSRRRLRARK